MLGEKPSGRNIFLICQVISVLHLSVSLSTCLSGLRAVFSELSSVSRAQQVALSELFNRVSFLQSFLLTEATCLSSICYNAAALCTSYLLTSTQRSSRAR